MTKPNSQKLKVYVFTQKKSLVGSTPGVNFTKVLHAAYIYAVPKGTKKLLDLTEFLSFWDLCE